MQRSVVFGGLLGALLGGLIGAGLGAMTVDINRVLIGLATGLLLGCLMGVMTAALTVKTAGTTGGIGVGYFTGMILGGVFGMLLGALIPASFWKVGFPELGSLMISRFESVVHISFLFSVLAAIVGVWVGGRNLVSSELKPLKHETIDQYDLVEIIQVPEGYQGIIDLGDIGIVLEIDDNESFEIECVQPDGSYKWLETLNSRYIRLKQKIPDNM
jgi:MFS family permease